MGVMARISTDIGRMVISTIAVTMIVMSGIDPYFGVPTTNIGCPIIIR